MNFTQLKDMVADVIDHRICNIPKSYKSKPTRFALLQRDDKLVCVWCRNVKKKEIADVIASINNPHKGYTLEEWNAIALKVYYLRGYECENVRF